MRLKVLYRSAGGLTGQNFRLDVDTLAGDNGRAGGHCFSRVSITVSQNE